ncbi:MAG: DUF4395 domain-containing protein [Anaerolineales bacterium]|nr:DUF4395 domain-containing protein [Anaerolineales bacterium]MCX7608107.1 DUF4395 domain-containing protein [Anaerolineales bacterium]MDW8228060.1 DUF4395 domain-containing protein [Anaerolineales bacterium]
MSELQKIDHSALIVSQITIVILNLLAFILNFPWLVALVAAAMLIGTLLGVPGFGFLYRLVLRPLGIVRPHVLEDHPQPHRFAQGLGGTFMLIATLSLFFGLPVLGWALTWLVAALAALNAFGGFCVGCFFYYWLARLRVPGFSETPPAGTFPGMRPKG